MKIELKKIKVSDLANGYNNDDATGRVVAYGGKLDVRPAYQREFVYKDEQQKAVIHTVYNGFPLNVMYWAVRDDGTFEVMDGQQRTISICQFCKSRFSVKLGANGDLLNYSNLKDEQRKRIDDYELLVYLCEGTDEEKLDWFRTINIAGEKLTEQEIRNAVYAGPWVSDAKTFFSKNGCVAYKLGNDYMSGTPIRQDYLETVIKWAAQAEGVESVEAYMSMHQKDANAEPLKDYFRNVVSWIEKTFKTKRKKEMNGLPWGEYFNDKQNETFDPEALEKKIAELMADYDVTNKKGVYPYVLYGQERYLSIRTFSERDVRTAYERQNGVCPHCGKKFKIEEMQADHITPWSRGGKTVPENCQMLCAECNRKKSNK